jgi:hypothetical protein
MAAVAMAGEETEAGAAETEASLDPHRGR